MGLSWKWTALFSLLGAILCLIGPACMHHEHIAALEASC